MSVSRRRFLKGSAAVVAATAAAPVLGSARRGRSLVAIELVGGNDALNTVIPVGDYRYINERPTLAIPANRALMLTETVGLHPAMREMHALYQAGQLAIVQGVGFGIADRSHTAGRELWHTAGSPQQGGWLARCARTMGDNAIASYAGIECPGMLISPLLHTTSFPATSLGQGLAGFAAQIIETGRSGVYHIAQNGYDTHAAQAHDHAQALRDLSQSVGAFLSEMRGHDVLVMIFSEFGRRLRENGSAGTDHGSAGVLFFAGAGVRGGLQGKLELDGIGELRATVDPRQCLANAERWVSQMW